MKDLADVIIEHYERHARDWDADRNLHSESWNDKPWHERFVAALPAGDNNVLDLGCGSAHPVGRYLAEAGFHVTGIDSSPTLISLCQERLPSHEWFVADMRSLQLHRKFGGILAWDSFFHLTPDDQRGMFEVFARHAAPAAVLMFNSGPAHGESIGSYRGDPLYHSSLGADEYTDMLEAFGFEVLVHVVEDWHTGGGRTVWLARRKTGSLDIVEPTLIGGPKQKMEGANGADEIVYAALRLCSSPSLEDLTLPRESNLV